MHAIHGDDKSRVKLFCFYFAIVETFTVTNKLIYVLLVKSLHSGFQLWPTENHLCVLNDKTS